MSGEPLRIAIDATAMPEQRAGAGIYTHELIRALARVDRENRYTILTRPGTFEDIARRGFRIVARKPGPRLLRAIWEQTSLPARLLGEDTDVFHSPHHTLPVLRPGHAARVVTFHDVTFFLMPERYPAARRYYMQLGTRAAAMVATRIIAPSHSTAADIARVFPRLRTPVDVVHEAAAPRFYEPPTEAELAEARSAHRLPERFILTVGTLEPGKNHAAAVRALALLRDRDVAQHLVIAGQPGWLYGDLLRLVDELGLRERVRFLGYVPDERLRALYHLADVFVFPSMHEGFGLPPLEAMACGTPVVVSDRSAMLEVVGEAGLLVDPEDDAAIADAIGRLLADSDLRDAYASRGRLRAMAFSWDEAARRTVEVYERAVQDMRS